MNGRTIKATRPKREVGRVYVPSDERHERLMFLAGIDCHLCGYPASYMNITRGEIHHVSLLVSDCAMGYIGDHGAAVGVARAFFRNTKS